MAAGTPTYTPTSIAPLAPFQKSVGSIPGATINNVATGTAVAGLSVQEYGSTGLRTTVFTFNAMPMTITDALVYASQQVYAFPKGWILHFGTVISNLFMTTTSAIASTLNSGVAVSIGLGTVVASSGTLATTMQNFSPGTGVAVTNLTSSTVINVAPAAFNATFAPASYINSRYDGTTTPIALYLNVAVPTNTDIDADATVIFSGSISVVWMVLGDY